MNHAVDYWPFESSTRMPYSRCRHDRKDICQAMPWGTRCAQPTAKRVCGSQRHRRRLWRFITIGNYGRSSLLDASDEICFVKQQSSNSNEHAGDQDINKVNDEVRAVGCKTKAWMAVIVNMTALWNTTIFRRHWLIKEAGSVAPAWARPS